MRKGDAVGGRGVSRLALAATIMLGVGGPAYAQAQEPSQALPHVIEGPAGGAGGPPPDAPPPNTQPPAGSPSLPRVIYGPAIAPQPAVAPTPPADARPQPAGKQCEAVLLLADRTIYCPLVPPLALGAECACPFPPPPPGLLPSPPARGRAIP